MKFILFIFIITSFFTIDSFGIGSSDRTLYFEQMDSKNDSVIDVLKSLDLTGTGYFKYPIGTTAQRPTASTGMSRYNSTEGCLELYNGSDWICVGAGGGGGGGSSGLNIVSDFSFENEELAPDALAGGSFSYESYTADDELYTEFNEKYYEISYGVPTPLSSADLYVRDTFSRTGLDDKAGLFSIRIKALLATGETLKLCVRIDDPDWSEACESYLEVPIIGDDTWHEYKIPIVYGASSVQYEIYNESYSGTASIAVDLVEFKIGNDLGTINESDTDWVASAVTTRLTNSTITAVEKRQGDDILIRGTIEFSAAPTGTGRIDIPYTIDTSKIANTATYQQAFGTGTAFQDASGIRQIIPVYYDNNTLHLIYENDANELKLVTPTNPITFGSGDSISFYFKIPIEGWSTGRVNAFSQRRELTANTANEFSVRLDASCNVISENYDFINGNCSSGGTGVCTCTYNSGIFTVIPSITCTALDSASTNLTDCSLASTSTNSFTINIDAVNATAYVQSNEPVEIHVSKQGDDVNKTVEVHGEFKVDQIKGACFNTTYSETEIECGMRNGEMLYRRCFTVASDITTTSTIATWDLNLKIINAVVDNAGRYILFSHTAQASSANTSVIRYLPSTGDVQAAIDGTYEVGGGSNFCLDYTK